MDKKSFVLGIDTGGTYTDAVLYDYQRDEIIKAGKSLTTYKDLSIGIENAIKKVISSNSSKIAFISISTTLATNMIVENKGGRVALILIGYDKSLIEKYNFSKHFNAQRIEYVKGGHDLRGEEKSPLDTETAKKFIQDNSDHVDVFAVSGYYSVYNNKHELIVKDLIKTICNKPVVCGHELSSQLDSIKRASTVTLNAGLIPRIKKLLVSIQEVADQQGIDAPIYVVKGDGSLITSEIALERPIETILSGPASSCIGVKKITGHQECIVADIGGTTTDIAVFKDGDIRVNQKGTNVGGYRTHVTAIDMTTIGLGGDSLIYLSDDGNIKLSSNRVTPLCRLSKYREQIMDYLNDKNNFIPLYHNYLAELVFMYYNDTNNKRDLSLSEDEKHIIDIIRPVPINIGKVAKNLNTDEMNVFRKTKRLEQEGIIQFSGFTPTDLLHCVGDFKKWDATISLKTFEILAKKLHKSDVSIKKDILNIIHKKFLSAIASVSFGEQYDENSFDYILDNIISREKNELASISFKIKVPLVIVGAPALSLFSGLRDYNPELCIEIPQNYSIANALGTACANITFRKTIKIMLSNLPDESKRYLIYTGKNIKSVGEKSQAIDYAKRIAAQQIDFQMEKAGMKKYSIKENIKEYEDVDYYSCTVELIGQAKP
ncbi:MAG: hydantoinase/oxoprolinase family protein [Clostridia bacterium]|nr:hydantoinase/oxoprolinase family protein [Clostridia bacterium]